MVFFPRETADQTPLPIFAVLGTLFIFVRYISGEYSRRRLFWDSARSTTVALIITSLPCFIILVAVPGQYSLFAEFGSWGFLLFGIPSLRQIARIAMTRVGIWRWPTALIASGSRACDLYEALNSTISLGFDIRWLALEGTDCAATKNLEPLKRIYLTDPQEIAANLAAEGCDQAVVATEDMQSPAFADLIQHLMEAGIFVSFAPSFRRLPLVGVNTSYFFGRDILLFQVRSSMQRLPNRVAKRLFDIVGSLGLLILLSPLFLFIAVAIKRFDGGPIIYRQKRTGRHGEPFLCLKFRTMSMDADEKLNRWRKDNPELYEEFRKTFKLVDDPRVTAPGKWLRKISLDELPQLANVLRGEMSLVGPRPVVERELIEYYGSAAQLYRRVRPGLTGLWQISGRSDTTYAERVVYDEWYILNWSFWYDIVILLQTVWAVIVGKGAY
jgi:undecaprenyl-phosphate galactose phosphotransferase